MFMDKLQLLDGCELMSVPPRTFQSADKLRLASLSVSCATKDQHMHRVRSHHVPHPGYNSREDSASELRPAPSRVHFADACPLARSGLTLLQSASTLRTRILSEKTRPRGRIQVRMVVE